MENVDYRTLYRVQDRVLEIVSRTDTHFYLTGGTCLNRFFFEKRYSADLDLFSNENNLFREDVRILLDALTTDGCVYEVSVDSRDFVRIVVQSTLKVDMVNDRVYRFGKSVRTPEGIVLDNTANIAANKICSVLGRDEPKDVFDLYTLFCLARLNWGDVLAASSKKCAIEMEVLEYRLNSFPLHLVDLLSVPSQTCIMELYDDKENRESRHHKRTQKTIFWQWGTAKKYTGKVGPARIAPSKQWKSEFYSPMFCPGY